MTKRADPARQVRQLRRKLRAAERRTAAAQARADQKDKELEVQTLKTRRLARIAKTAVEAFEGRQTIFTREVVGDGLRAQLADEGVTWDQAMTMNECERRR